MPAEPVGAPREASSQRLPSHPHPYQNNHQRRNNRRPPTHRTPCYPLHRNPLLPVHHPQPDRHEHHRKPRAKRHQQHHPQRDPLQRDRCQQQHQRRRTRHQAPAHRQRHQPSRAIHLVTMAVLQHSGPLQQQPQPHQHNRSPGHHPHRLRQLIRPYIRREVQRRHP